jgi:LytR cell envelope-related transcriptional attenuator
LLELVQDIGAAAGFAAGVGVPLLAALHRSQARDVKRLRAWLAPRQIAVTPPRRARSVAVALVGVLVLGAAAYAATRHRSGDAPTTKAAAAPKKPKRNGAAVKPGAVTVAVLNGTMVPGLAAALREEIAAAGFKKGRIDVFADQQLAESVVQYAPGRQAEAKAVGRTVRISRREPVTAATRALAGDATVTVIAGADKAP